MAASGQWMGIPRWSRVRKPVKSNGVTSQGQKSGELQPNCLSWVCHLENIGPSYYFIFPPPSRGERSAGDPSLAKKDLNITVMPHLPHLFTNESIHTERQKAGGQCAGGKWGCTQCGFFPKWNSQCNWGYKTRKSPTTALPNRNRMQTTCLKCSRSCNKQKETDGINLMILHLAQYSQNIILTYNQYRKINQLLNFLFF